jgi:cystathionine beta-lyase
MMREEFDQIIDRRGTASLKWEGMAGRFGVSDALPLWVADMDFRTAPAVVDALVRRARHGIFGYTIRTADYVDAIGHWLRTRHGWDVDPDWLVFSPGVVTGLAVAIEAWTEPGDGIVIQPPVYHPFRRLIAAHGRRVVESPLRLEGERYRMDLDDLQDKLQMARLLLLAHPHNPVGRVWTAEELEAVGALAEQQGVFVVADEVHADLVYPGVEHVPFARQNAARAAATATFMAPSKTFNLAGLNTSFGVIPDPTRRRAYQAVLERYHLDRPNPFGVAALEAAYRHGGAWLDALRDYLADNLAFVRQYLTEHLPAVRVIPPEGTYLLWLDCRDLGLDAEELDRVLLREARVALDPGYLFGEEGRGFQRMNIACPRAMLGEALVRMARVLGESGVRRP